MHGWLMQRASGTLRLPASRLVPDTIPLLLCTVLPCAGGSRQAAEVAALQAHVEQTGGQEATAPCQAAPAELEEYKRLDDIPWRSIRQRRAPVPNDPAQDAAEAGEDAGDDAGSVALAGSPPAPGSSARCHRARQPGSGSYAFLLQHASFMWSRLRRQRARSMPLQRTVAGAARTHGFISCLRLVPNHATS